VLNHFYKTVRRVANAIRERRATTVLFAVLTESKSPATLGKLANTGKSDMPSAKPIRDQGGMRSDATRCPGGRGGAVTALVATFRRSWTVTWRAYPFVFFIATLMLGGLTVGLAYFAWHVIGGGQVGGEFVEKTGTADYFSYVAVGAASFMFTVRLFLGASRDLITEQRGGTLGALLVAPGRRVSYLLGFAAFALFQALLEVIALIVFAIVLGASMTPVYPGTLLVGVLALTASVLGVAVPFACVMVTAGEAHITQNTFIYAVAVLCGFTFPTSYLPGPVQFLGELVPITPALDVLRGGMTGHGSVATMLPELLIALGLSLVYAFAGLAWLPHALRRAMERTF
jgi:ABC-2 type transport system permease protein